MEGLLWLAARTVAGHGCLLFHVTDGCNLEAVAGVVYYWHLLWWARNLVTFRLLLQMILLCSFYQQQHKVA
ncbi:UNVERIFIED_CONTAM: hypothetical protein FKN15_029857 [Acipenser sinensis]